jgi:hypothetical protein
MEAEALIASLAQRGIRLFPDGDGIIVEPASRLTEADRDAIRDRKREILALLSRPEAARRYQQAKATCEPENAAPIQTCPEAIERVEMALALIRRLRSYVLPSGRLEAAKALAARLRPLLKTADFDPAEALQLLTGVEHDLIQLGGSVDPSLADGIEAVTRTFPGAKLVS